MEVAFLLGQSLSHGLCDTKGTNIISQQDTTLWPQITAFKNDHGISY